MNSRLFLAIVLLSIGGSSCFAQSRVFVTDTSAAGGPWFSFVGSVCDPMPADRAQAFFTIAEPLFVSIAVVDSLGDTVYAFEPRRYETGKYEIDWMFADSRVENLPILLWFQLDARPGPTKALRYYANVMFCVVR